jgi:hypothetical protein
LESISLKNNGIQTGSKSTRNSKKTSFGLCPKRVAMRININPSMSNPSHMITTNSSQINIIRPHSNIKINLMPSRGRGGPWFMCGDSGLLGGEFPSLLVEEESFVYFIGNVWGWGGWRVGLRCR